MTTLTNNGHYEIKRSGITVTVVNSKTQEVIETEKRVTIEQDQEELTRAVVEMLLTKYNKADEIIQEYYK